MPTRTGGDASGTWGINITGDAGTVDGLNASSFLRSDANDTATGELTISLIKLGNGDDGYFYSDINGRGSWRSGDFYFQSINTYYNYATNQYIGNTSGDNIYFRGNALSGNSWSISTAGVFTGDGSGLTNVGTAATGVVVELLTVNLINANHIAANSITANMIQANQVKASELEVSSTASVANSIFIDGTNKRIDIKDASNVLRVRIGQL